MKFFRTAFPVIVVCFMTFAIPGSAICSPAAEMDLSVERIPLDQGAPLHMVFTAAQTEDGFLWFGTMYGLLRYDGYEFVHFRHDPGDSTSINNDDVISIFEDSRGYLWVGTFGGGVNRLDRSTGVFDHSFGPEDSPVKLSEGIIWGIDESPDGSLWFGTNSRGLIQLSPQTNTISRYRHDPENEFSLSHDGISDIEVVSNNQIWVSTYGGGLNRFNPDEGEFTIVVPDDGEPIGQAVQSLYWDGGDNLWIGTIGEGLKRLNFRSGSVTKHRWPGAPPRSINDISGDQEGRIVLGTSDGVIVLTAEGEFITSRKHDPEDSRSLYNNRVSAICVDQSENIWASSYVGGLNKLVLSEDQFMNYLPDPLSAPGSPRNNIRAVAPLDGERILLGTGDGLFVARQEQGGRGVRKIMPGGKSYPDESPVSALMHDRSGNIWVGTASGVYILSPELNVLDSYHGGKSNSMTSFDVSCLLQDRDGNVWVGTKSGLNRISGTSREIVRFRSGREPSSSLQNDYILSLHEDAEGTIWIGTYGGTARFDPPTNRFVHYVQDSRKPSGISNNYALAFFEDSEGSLWIGTGGGLNRFNRESETFTHIFQRDGLPSSVIYGIAEERPGILWMSTQYGLSRFDIREGTFTNFDTRDGLPSNMFNSEACAVTRGGRILFGSIHGLTVVRTETLGVSSFAPPVAITRFDVLNEDGGMDQTARNSSMELSYDQNYFTVHFASLDFSRSEKNQYMYLLEGIDDGWVSAGGDRQATYTDIAPGTYRFTVKGTNSHGVWSTQEAGLTVTIMPPFWKTWWFYSLLTLLILLSLVLLHQWRVREKVTRLGEIEEARKEEAERIRKKAARDFHDELGHRLTKIGLFAELVKRRIGPSSLETARHIDKILESSQALSDDTRNFLWSLDPARDSLYDLVTYLRNFGEELFERTGVAFETTGLNESMKKMKLSMDFRRHLALILKEAMNNSLRHSQCSQIIFAVSAENGDLRLSISDNGRGYNPGSNEGGYGLKNMKIRAQQIKGDFAIHSDPGHGTNVSFIAHAA